MVTRRTFCRNALSVCLAGQVLPHPNQARCEESSEDQEAGAGSKDAKFVEARFYEKLEGLKVRCLLCPRQCTVADRERGYCGVRENRGGTYYTLVHSNPCTVHVDPIEKKPLFHFLPGKKAFSMATVGCNIECKFCQNWELSQFTPEQRPSFRLPPEQAALNAAERGSACLAFTYTEPVVFYEYMADCAAAARKKGIKSVMISNGYIEEKPLRDLVPLLDAVKIDLKAFTEKFYTELCSGRLEPVLRTLRILEEMGIWYEIVVLLIPTKNDSSKELSELCAWVASELSVNVPLHFTRFHPIYKIKDLPPTPLAKLEEAYAIAKEKGLRFPYIGNVVGNRMEHTFCPHCGKAVIQRLGFYLAKLDIEKGNCNFCGNPIPGIWA